MYSFLAVPKRCAFSEQNWEYELNMKKICFAALFLISAVSAQEALKSTEEEYYYFLSLTGQAVRPTLGYRTLSDSEWKITDENHIWSENNLGTKYTLYENENPAENWFTNGIDQSVKVKIYGPEWFNSYNTAAPYGQNDGALWQGKGYNTSLTAGARLEGYGFELTFKPQLSFSQNKEFDLADNSAYYTNKYAYVWGYGNNVGADAPQRFGDSSFWTYDWGDTEARWSWHTFTLGFGTQAIWLGPAWLNPVLHSNNAPTYPKVDVGLRKTEIYMPFFDWDLGAIEGRLWTGYLSESDYFDEDSSNDHNMIHGLSMSYAPSFLPGLTLTANRICLVKWKMSNLKYVIPKSENTYVGDTSGNGEDQKMSVSADWLFPKVGFEVFGEVGVDDYTSLEYYFERTLTYTVGLKKYIRISEKYNLNGEIIFEWNNTEMSQDFQWQWAYNFGFHHQITQGYTNRGQWIGSGSGYGGNSQYLGFKIYHTQGNITIFVQHVNPDMNYIYSQAISRVANWAETMETFRPKSIWNYGISTSYFLTHNLLINGVFVYSKILNPCYYSSVLKTDNISLACSVKYEF